MIAYLPGFAMELCVPQHPFAQILSNGDKSLAGQAVGESTQNLSTDLPRLYGDK
jgi:hypothetical protein